MPGDPTEHAGGKMLLAGGVLQILAIALHPSFANSQEATAMEPMTWALIHWAYLFSDLLLGAGFLITVRAFLYGASQGWSAIAVMSALLAFALDAVSSSIHLITFPQLVDDFRFARGGVQTTYDATEAVNASIGGVAFAFQFIAIAALGFSLKHVRRFSGTAIVGIIIGALQLLLFIPTTIGYPILPTTGIVSIAVAAIVPLWLVYVGVKLAGDRGLLPGSTAPPP